MTATAANSKPQVKQSRFMRKALPYLLSLPALLMCIGILIPFFTAVYYSMLRYRLNLPADEGLHLVRQLRQFLLPIRSSGTRSISRCSMRS